VRKRDRTRDRERDRDSDRDWNRDRAVTEIDTERKIEIQR
jgi:hypothetical protein